MICKRKGCDRLAGKCMGILVTTPCERHGEHTVNCVLPIPVCAEHATELCANPVDGMARQNVLHTIAAEAHNHLIEDIARSTTVFVAVDMTAELDAALSKFIDGVRSVDAGGGKPWLN